jgi:phospholipid transport system substrate-binding protein
MTKKIFFTTLLSLITLIFIQSNNLIASPKNPSQWVEDISNQTLIILGNDKISNDKKAENLEEIFIENLDIKKISLFILGPYRTNLNSSESSKNFNAIKNFISKVNAKRLSSYPSGNIKIIKVEEKGRRGIIVSSLINFNDRPNPISIDWWILKSSVSDYKVFDIRISGIWMAQEQRSTFTSFLSKNNGEIANLINKIELQIK